MENQKRQITKLQNKKTLVALILIIVTMASLALMSGTFAKYATTITGTGSGTGASWGVSFLDGDPSQTFNYTLTDANASNTIAPGSKGSFKVYIDGSTTDVDFLYSIDIVKDNTLMSKVIEFYYDDTYSVPATHGSYDGIMTKNTKKTLVVYWQWVTTSDAEDTAIGALPEADRKMTFQINATATQLVAGTAKKVTTIADINALNDGDTAYLTADITEASDITINKAVNINLDGHTITANSITFSSTYAGAVAIKHGKLAVTGTGDIGKIVIAMPNATVNLAVIIDGTLIEASTASHSFYLNSQFFASGILTSGTVSLKGGKLVVDKSTVEPVNINVVGGSNAPIEIVVEPNAKVGKIDVTSSVAVATEVVNIINRGKVETINNTDNKTVICTSSEEATVGTIEGTITSNKMPKVTINKKVGGNLTEFETQSILPGELAKRPSILVGNQGLLGFYTDEACTIPFDFEKDKITADCTIYANIVDDVITYSQYDGVTDSYYAGLNNNKACIEVNLLAEYDGKPVYGVGADLFKESAIQFLKIPYGYTSIDAAAFSKCSSLTSITIPNSVTCIGNDAFYYCRKLTSITLPNSVTSIGDYAFYECGSITSIIIPNSVTSIGDYAFYECSSLTSITLPNGITSINNSAFWGCRKLTSVTIPNSVTRIGLNAFNGCSGLTSVTIPNSVTRIGDYAFNGCISLIEIAIPNSVTNIGNGAFNGCSNLVSLTIPNSVTSIGSNAVAGCNKLTIYAEADSKPNGWATDWNIWDRPVVWNGYCHIVEGNITYRLKDGIATVYTASKNIITVDIKETITYNGATYTVTSIGMSAFNSCSKLTSVEIPNSVTSIGNNAFKSCTSLAIVTFAEGSQLTSIGNNAFQSCSNLTSITLPNSLTSIGESAFNGCSKLISVILPDGVTSIGNSAFYGCSGLTSVTFAEGSQLTSISYAAFQNCTGLTSVTLPNGITSIGNYAFSGCSSLTSIKIPGSVTSIGRNAFFGCRKLTSVEIPGSVTEIGDNAFQTCSSLTSVTLPNGITKISASVFFGCSGLTSVTIPASVTEIDLSAFSGCTKLASVTFAEGSQLTSIGKTAFKSCTGLTSVTIPASVTKIDESAFNGCSSLTSVTFAEGSQLTSIGISAFNACSSLTTITIPGSVISLGDYAFSECSSLTTIYAEAASKPDGWATDWNHQNISVEWNHKLEVTEQI